MEDACKRSLNANVPINTVKDAQDAIGAATWWDSEDSPELRTELSSRILKIQLVENGATLDRQVFADSVILAHEEVQKLSWMLEEPDRTELQTELSACRDHINVLLKATNKKDVSEAEVFAAQELIDWTPDEDDNEEIDVVGWQRALYIAAFTPEGVENVAFSGEDPQTWSWVNLQDIATLDELEEMRVVVESVGRTFELPEPRLDEAEEEYTDIDDMRFAVFRAAFDSDSDDGEIVVISSKDPKTWILMNLESLSLDDLLGLEQYAEQLPAWNKPTPPRPDNGAVGWLVEAASWKTQVQHRFDVINSVNEALGRANVRIDSLQHAQTLLKAGQLWWTEVEERQRQLRVREADIDLVKAATKSVLVKATDVVDASEP